MQCPDALAQAAVAVAAAALAGLAGGGEIEVPSFTDGSESRLVAGSIGLDDPAEKDYALADLDQDGDLDVVVARRQGLGGANNGAALPNALLVNEDGVLTERTLGLAPALLAAARSRDVLVADLNGDRWPDVLVADGPADPPLLLLNLGENEGVWRGLAAETGALPPGLLLDAWTLAAGDLRGDGDAYPDVYIGVRSGDDRLLVNRGAPKGSWLGFADESVKRLGGNAITSAVRSSAVADLNQDGDLDIVAGVTLPSGEVRLLSNDGSGVFTAAPQVLSSGSAYNFGLGHLDDDGLLDIFGVRNGLDQYRRNLGAGSGDTLLMEAPSTATGSSGFGSICRVADVNGDGTDDFLVADLDQEFPADCSRRLRVYLNSGVAPYLTDAYPMAEAWTPHGTSDVAPFDLDGDGDMDLLIGHCAGHSVFLQDSPRVPGDVTGDGAVNVQDLVAIIIRWGPCVPSPGPEGCAEDLNHDGVMNVEDVVIVIVNWG